MQVPHVCTKEQAEHIAKITRYGEGGRGYAALLVLRVMPLNLCLNT
ncbi:hypothetical protein JCM19236_574 [Vibrio sp. JCM 19236]|nr:hypothetical protein JCM19236_574 [Vibrio sp. JCM 19236]